MKKSFFQKTFNLNIYLLAFGIFGGLLKFGVHMLIQVLGTLNLLNLHNIIILFSKKVSIAEHYIQTITVFLFIILFALVTIECGQRVTRDSLWNYFKSVYQTLRMRQFLKQEEYFESSVSIDNQTVTRFNPILKSFNQVISKCTIDIRKETVTVFLKFPRTQQAQKLLKEMEEDVKEEISNRNPRYYFSSPNRVGNELWFKGTKR